jgi:hypothetical protein
MNPGFRGSPRTREEVSRQGRKVANSQSRQKPINQQKNQKKSSFSVDELNFSSFILIY